MGRSAAVPRSPEPDRVDRLLADWRRERPELDASAMAVVGRLLHLGRLLEARASRALKPFGINYTELDVLATLRRTGRPHELTPTALCGSVLVTSGTMTVCLDRLEAAGLVERRAADTDRRSRAVALTPAGRRLVDRAIAVRFAEAREAIAALGAAERRTMARSLARLTRALGS